MSNTPRVHFGDQLPGEDESPSSLCLNLVVSDRDTVARLLRFPAGESREQFALEALRIGVLAINQAQGEIDAQAVRVESERLLTEMQSRLREHSQTIQNRLGDVLAHYFDPHSGRFHERVERLIRKDGELETVLRRQIGQDDSALCQTLAWR